MRMDQIEQLLSKFKDYNATELHLDSNQRPYYSTPAGAYEISTMPIQHKDIVLLLSPILSPTAKSELMERSGTEFPHRSPSGNFVIAIKKTNLGFNVLIR